MNSPFSLASLREDMTSEASNLNKELLGSLLSFNTEAVGGREGIKACLE